MDTKTFALTHISDCANALKEEYYGSYEDFNIIEFHNADGNITDWEDAVKHVINSDRREAGWVTLVSMCREHTVSLIEKIHRQCGVEALDVISTEDLMLYADMLIHRNGPFDTSVIEKMYLSESDIVRRAGALMIIDYKN